MSTQAFFFLPSASLEILENFRTIEDSISSTDQSEPVDSNTCKDLRYRQHTTIQHTNMSTSFENKFPSTRQAQHPISMPLKLHEWTSTHAGELVFAMQESQAAQECCPSSTHPCRPWPPCLNRRENLFPPPSRSTFPS